MKSISDQLATVQTQLFGVPQTVTIIFDECNLQLASLSLRGRRVDYQAVCDRILEGCRCVFAKPNIITDKTDGVDTFEQAMVRRGFGVEVVESKKIDGQLKNLTDSYIHRAIYEAGDSDTDVVALVSGDSDFEPALSYIKQFKGKLVEVYALRDVLSMELWAVADEAVYLDELF